MTTAIVTITCPSCGGKVEGVTATNTDQTIKCTYCGIELHVPRVGEVIHEVVHEVIREVPSQPQFIDYSPTDIKPKQNPMFALILLGIGAVVAIPVLCSQQQHSNETIKRIDDEQAKQTQCEASCKEKCKGAAAHEDRGMDPESQKVIADADHTICESTCIIDDDCFSLKKH